MLIDDTHRVWVIGSPARFPGARNIAVLAGVATVGYLAYIVTSPGRPSGGSIPGLVFAFAGTALIVFAGSLSWRKKYPASPMGRVSTWLRAHIWLGLLSFLLLGYALDSRSPKV